MLKLIRESYILNIARKWLLRRRISATMNLFYDLNRLDKETLAQLIGYEQYVFNRGK